MHDEPTDPNPPAFPRASKQRELLRLPLDRVTPSKTNPRTSLEKEAFLELKKSIAKNGLWQPILVRAKHERYEIVGGHRRFQAVSELARELPSDARFSAIDALLLREEEDAGVAQLADNLNRADLTAIEIADGIGALLKTGMTKQQVADHLGWQKRKVYKYTQLLDADDWLRDLAKAVVVRKRPGTLDGAGGAEPALETLPGLQFSDWNELAILFNHLHAIDIAQLQKRTPGYAAKAEAIVVAVAERGATEQWSSARYRDEAKRIKEGPKKKERRTNEEPAFTNGERRIIIDVQQLAKLASAQREQFAMELTARLRNLGFAASIKGEPIK